MITRTLPGESQPGVNRASAELLGLLVRDERIVCQEEAGRGLCNLFSLGSDMMSKCQTYVVQCVGEVLE